MFSLTSKEPLPISGIKKGKKILAMIKIRSDVTKMPAMLPMLNLAKILLYYIKRNYLVESLDKMIKNRMV